LRSASGRAEGMSKTCDFVLLFVCHTGEHLPSSMAQIEWVGLWVLLEAHDHDSMGLWSAESVAWKGHSCPVVCTTCLLFLDDGTDRNLWRAVFDRLMIDPLLDLLEYVTSVVVL